MKNKELSRLVLKITPYFAAFIVGLLIYYLSGISSGRLSDLLVNISATFISVPLLFLFYEIVKSYVHKRLNLEIFDYAKLQIDRDILSILNQLQKIVFALETVSLSEKNVTKFLALTQSNLEKEFKSNEYIGFQVFKNWEMSEKSLQDLLKNPYILGKMEDEQIISILDILKDLRELQDCQKIVNLYVDLNKTNQVYKIVHGSDINPIDNKLPDRYVLLRHINDKNFKVVDFGDINKYNFDKSLNTYKVNPKYIDLYTTIIYNLLHSIGHWINSTGSELIIDTKMFKLSANRENKSP